MSDTQQLHLRSSVFPATDLLTTYFDRDVTRLSDRGLASNLIGDRWSDVSAEELLTWTGQEKVLPDGSLIQVEMVIRLDDTPRIATIASRRKLQNPDFIMVGWRREQHIALAIDAKFSIETAKPSQVAAETLQALLDVAEEIPGLLPELPRDITCIDGIFISPDTALTAWVLGQHRGRFAARVTQDRVIRLPARPVPFLKPLPGARLIAPLAQLDGFRNEIRDNFLLAMYYFRLARACFGAYLETRTPILGYMSEPASSMIEFEQLTIDLARNAQTAWDVVLAWDSRAEQVRAQREAVFGAMRLPIGGRQLRELILAEAELRGIDAPSLNGVRKRIAGWYRAKFDERIGIVMAPVDDLAGLIETIHETARELQPFVAEAVDSAIDDAFQNVPPATEPTTA